MLLSVNFISRSAWLLPRGANWGRKTSRMTLGVYPGVGVADARIELGKARGHFGEQVTRCRCAEH